VARAEKIKLKSVGLLLLAIFPGAFVEPDEKQVKKAKILTKLRIFSAGSFANFVTAFLVFLLTLHLIWPISALPGVELLGVNASSPAGLAGLKSDMVITEVNGIPIRTTYAEYLGGRGYFWDELKYTEPNQTIRLKADENYYDITLGFSEETNSTYMGIVYAPIFKIDREFFMGSLIPLLNMIFLFSFAIGLINILPIYPLDGGLIVQAIAERFAKKRSKEIVRVITLIVLIILIYNFIGPFL